MAASQQGPGGYQAGTARLISTLFTLLTSETRILRCSGVRTLTLWAVSQRKNSTGAIHTRLSNEMKRHTKKKIDSNVMYDSWLL